MRDFVKTMDFVAKFNALAEDVNKCVFADQRTSRNLIEQDYMLFGDDAFNRPPRTMGEWELEQFKDATDKLENELKELPGELVELSPTMADMPQYFRVWENILKRMVTHDLEWWTERESESFWEVQGVKEWGRQFLCTLAVVGLHSLSFGVQKMIADVMEKYAINAPQSQATAQAEQLATEDLKGRQGQRKRQGRAFRDYMTGEDADDRLERARKVKGQGRDALREIMNIAFPKKLSDYPSYPAFVECFGEIISRTDYYAVKKEFF